MQITETNEEGLKRTLKVVVAAGELSERFTARLDDIKGRVQLKGFRKGKVPVSHLKKLYGRSLMAEVLQETVKETSSKALSERNERPALQPDIALPEDTSHHDILWLISECERGRVTIRVYPDLFQIMAGPVGIGEMGGIPILTVRDIALTGWRRIAKRLMDIAGSAVGLIFLSPFMMVIAILIKLESPGPVFFVQERMGLDAKPFPILKFRSMRQDAEKSGTWTTENDPRRTKMGAFLRKTNIDEFPQLINIFLGDMSLVGPRPEQPYYVEQFRRSIPRYMDRHREKAGLTGWAQINGYRQDTSITERTKYDLWYIENWSLMLDIKIIIRTALQFFRSPNAY